MRIAIITPYHRQDEHKLEGCYLSVMGQTHPVTHLMVADGFPAADRRAWASTMHVWLDHKHGDAGATPRAIGAISALSHGFDAVGFLDVDNKLAHNHVNEMLGLMARTGSSVVTATRMICTHAGESLYVDDIESDGKNFCDTNCIFLGRAALHTLTSWVTDKEKHLVSDREFWSALLASGLTIANCKTPTVYYHSRWAWHYHRAGVPIPPDAVWIDKDDNGNLIHTRHEQTTNWKNRRSHAS